VQEDEGDFVSTVRTEAGAEERDTSAVRALDGLYFFAGNVRGDDCCTGGKVNF
jgi:hypothetical protein